MLDPTALVNLARLRMERGITQVEMAETAGIVPPHLSEIESGKKMPSWEVAVRLANILNCSLDELLFRERFTKEARRNRMLRDLALLDRAIAEESRNDHG